MAVTASLKRAVGYCRVSTAEQAGERHSSLETQEARIRAHCQRLGWVPVATFVDVASGRRDDRLQYQRMVSYVMGGGADAIVVQFVDRLGRNPREILRRVWELQEHGVEVVATDEDIREELVLLIKAGVAGAESKRNSERVRANMTKAAEKGDTHFGRAPYGYRRVRQGERVSFEQDPLEAHVVREMARLVVDENLGYKSVADRLTAAGVPARRGRWASDTIRRILANEALVGTLVFNKRPRKGNPAGELVRVPGFYPAILSADEWAALQARLAIRRENPRGRTQASTYLLSGIARCGCCGGPMVGKKGYARKGRVYRNYWCANALRSRALCAYYNGHSAPRLEAAILEYLGQYSDPERVRALLAEAAPREAERAERELEAIDRRLVALDGDFQQNLDLLKRGVLDEAEFVRANQARRQERQALEARRAELAERVEADRGRAEAAAALPIRVRSFLEDFAALDTRRAKALLQTILKAAHVYRSGEIELEFR